MAATANIKLVGTSSLTEVDSNNDNALFVEARTPAISGQKGLGGAYSVAVSSGSILYTNLSSNPVTLFSFRWTHPDMLCLLHRLSLQAVTDATVTTGFLFAIGASVGRNYIVTATGETQVNIAATPNDQKLSTSFAPSQIQITDIRMSSTNRITNGTLVKDANKNSISNTFQSLGYILGNTGTTAPSWVFPGGPGLIPLLDYTGVGQSPLVLSRYEGILLDCEPSIIGGPPSTGSFQMVVQVEWMEVSSY